MSFIVILFAFLALKYNRQRMYQKPQEQRGPESSEPDQAGSRALMPARYMSVGELQKKMIIDLS